MSEKTPALTKTDVRSGVLKASDPLAMLIAGVFLVAANAGLVDLLGLTAAQVAEIQSGILMVAAAVRWYLESRNAESVRALSESREAKAHRVGLLKPQPVERHGREGGSLDLDPGDLADGETTAPDGKVDRRGTGSALTSLVAIGSFLILTASACTPAQVAAVRPGLGAVVSAVDVRRLIQCGAHLPDYKAAAQCLGAEAVTQGLRIALDRAHALAERAVEASGPAGADDMTDDERGLLAAELDDALVQLAVEIDATHVAE